MPPPMWNMIKENYEKLLIIATLLEAIACLFEQMLKTVSQSVTFIQALKSYDLSG